MQHKWNKRAVEHEVVSLLSKELKVNKKLAVLMSLRGITNYDEARSFFNPSKNQLHNPFLMKDMQKAVERIRFAVENNQKILIYGDYDVDGTTAVAVVFKYLKKFYKNIDFYIPDRFTEGYGISIKGIDFAKEHNFKLVITLDCGIKAIESIKYAKENNIDFIVADHHTPGIEIPDAVAVLDSKQVDCNYPYKELSGCGVGFKLIQAYSKYSKNENDVFDNIDLLAVSIAADMVLMTGENRVLTSLGLEKLNKNPSIAMKAMIGLNQNNLNINDLIFRIAPKINSSGRISNGHKSVELLISDNEEEANIISQKINKINTKRKNLDERITKEAIELAQKEVEELNKKIIIVYKEGWHKGVIGIVASRLVDRFYRPTLVFSKSDDDILVGSARSIKDFNIYDALEQSKEFLLQFGGHFHAAGVSLKQENFKQFKERIEQIVETKLVEEKLIPVINFDVEILFEDINRRFFNTLQRFEPHGPGNPKPVFISKKVKHNYPPSTVGKKHLKLNLRQNNVSFDCIAFGFGEEGKKDMFTKIKNSEILDIIYTIEENTWNGISKLQLNIIDFKTT